MAETYSMGAFFMNLEYSVLMSVYKKECPEYFRAAILSILNQTIKAREIILVCDGFLTDELERVLAEFSQSLTLVRLEKNSGLGSALAAGISQCSCEWIARMDSDDIAVSNRCEKQISYIESHPWVDVLSGTVAEFEGDAVTVEDAERQFVSYKYVPGFHEEIAIYIKSRNPINHPCVMFRKSEALKAGGYQPCYLFEDYDLWVRMFQNKCSFANLADTILYMRVNNMHIRRGGMRYVKALVVFWTKMYRCKLVGLPQFICITILRVGTSLCPNKIRKMIYDKKLRNR